jgi:hypothetical protein
LTTSVIEGSHERTFPRKRADPQTGAGRSRQRRLFGLTLRLE